MRRSAIFFIVNGGKFLGKLFNVPALNTGFALGDRVDRQVSKAIDNRVSVYYKIFMDSSCSCNDQLFYPFLYLI